MKILVLGNSDTAGTALPDPSQAWPRLIERDLAARAGEPAEVLHKQFHVHVEGAPAYLEKLLREQEPDLLILALSAYAFSTPSVSIRLSQLIGRRAGTWANQRFNAFDAHTRGRGELRRQVNRGAHWLARNTVGQSAHTSSGAVADLYRAAIDRLAREESMQVIVLSAAEHGPRLAARYPKVNHQVRELNAKLQTASDARRFGWIDRERLLSDTGRRDSLYADGLHKTEDFHRIMADALLPLIGRSVAVAK